MRKLALWCALAGVLLSVAECYSATELVLYTQHRVERNGREISGVLHRELARQAVLIAARDELGMLTCDATLREEPRTAEPLKLLLTSEAPLGPRFKMRLFKVDDYRPGQAPPPPGEAIWSKQFDYVYGSKTTYPTIVGPLHELATTEIAELLREQGGEAHASEQTADETLLTDEQINNLLMKTDVISQFAAVRALHHRLTADENAGDLQALARGYANLALLTETSWGATQQALHARALMYSQRQLALFPDDPLSKWTDAYVQGVTGVQFRALEMLDEIGSLPKPEAPLPIWTQLIKPYCEFDSAKLLSLSDFGGDAGQWAAYLRAWTVYNSGEERRMADVGREAMELCPEATNLARLLIYTQPTPIMLYATQAEVASLVQQTPLRLQETPSIPPAVVERTTVNSPTTAGDSWRSYVDALRADHSPREPSWSMLAALLDDQAVRAAANLYHVTASNQGQRNIGPVVTAMERYVEKHPDAEYFRICSQTGDDRQQAIREATGAYFVLDPNPWMRKALAWVYGDGKEVFGGKAYHATSREFTAQSLTNELKDLKPEASSFEMFLRELGKVAPKSPIVLVKEIEQAVKDDRQIPAENFERWEELAGSSSKVWSQLAVAYLDAGQTEDAIRCYEESISQSPEIDSFVALGKVYYNSDQRDMYVPTLEQALDVEAFANEHYWVEGQIAEFFMRERDYQAAKPHAENAALSNKGWSIELIGLVCEQLGELVEADAWFRRLSTRYNDSYALRWYSFRLRTGSEDLAPAREVARESLGPEEQWSSITGGRVVVFLVLEQDYATLAQVAAAEAERSPSWYLEALQLIAGVRLNDPEAARAAQQRLAALSTDEEYADSAEWLVEFAALLDQALAAAPDEEQPVADTIEAYLLDDSNKANLCQCAYLFGKLLQSKGFESPAKRCFERAVETQQWAVASWTFAKIELNRRAKPRANRLRAPAIDYNDPSI